MFGHFETMEETPFRPHDGTVNGASGSGRGPGLLRNTTGDHPMQRTREPFMKKHLPLILFPLVKLWVHLLTFQGYGVFRDELYYIACSRRPAAGYVDHPPLSIWILRGVREVFGDSLFVMRLVSALAAAATVLVVGCIARRLGAGLWGQSLAMGAFCSAPVFWFSGHVYSMNVFDVLIWSLVGRLWLGPKEGERRWGVIGGFLGLGLLNKISVLWLGAGLAAALALTADRKTLRTPGPWLAGGLSLVIFLPYLIWQWTYDWPTLEFIANATGEKMRRITVVDFWRGQMNIFGLPVLLVGLLGGISLWRCKEVDRDRRRGLVVVFVTVMVILMAAGNSRSGYAAPAYSWLLAAGGVALEKALHRRSTLKKRLFETVVVSILAIRGAMALPFMLPILPIESYLSYARALGVTPSTEERKEVAELPQHFADMFGWREKVEGARRVWSSLPAEERSTACFVAFNYGVAGALESETLIRSRHGTARSSTIGPSEDPLPPVVSGHNNFWYWRPDGCELGPWIVIGGSREGLLGAFGRVERATTVDCDYCMPYEDRQPIFIARDARQSLDAAWPSLKHFD